MNIQATNASRDLDRIQARIRELDLERPLAELDAYGFTVLEPGRAAPLAFCDQLRERILELGDLAIANEAKGSASSERTSAQARQLRATGQQLFYLLFKDPIFEKALMNDAALALINHLLGEAAVLSSLSAMIKGAGKEGLMVHTDNAMIPSPFPYYAQVANATWMLTDYSKKEGALFVVPGSHKYCRHPTRNDRVPESMRVAVEAPRGSMVVWHGNLWHGSYPREAPGLRVNLIMLFCRMYCRTQEPYRTHTPTAVLERQSPRFARLMGQHIAYGWSENGPDFTTEERRLHLSLERQPLERLFD